MDDGFGPLENSPTLGQRVHAVLQQQIIDRKLQPGERLVETELATRLGVSRGPVREALQGLQQLGWVEVRPRQGSFVHTPTPDEIADFFSVRAVLEGEAARAGAARATIEDAARLRKIVAAGQEVLSGSAAGSEHDLNQEFHEAVTIVAGNEFLASLIRRLGERTRWYMAPLIGIHSAEAWNEHRAIAEAISEGDERAAEERMKLHVQNTQVAYERLRSALAENSPAS